jgi:hypothetical protein
MTKLVNNIDSHLMICIEIDFIVARVDQLWAIGPWIIKVAASCSQYWRMGTIPLSIWLSH